ncbi:hypothetical protein G7Y89_g403 [Cudoniella acicularis]|uniref:Uncharacterized protein n=1 Tax=Cudoniella acicularis TaxID=354080 RepID=A0A8H4RY45_9HELO|nr:hypothetical protein G7Y89_g403 [Cudoniella acicularis]
MIGNLCPTGKHPTRQELSSVDELETCGGWDLGILTAPIDDPASLPHFPHLVDWFGIPSAFVAERFQSVTHSFGTRKLRDESEIVWIRFLALLPSLPFDGKPRWVKSGLVLKWSPTPPSNSNSTSEPSRQVTLICFQPVPGILLAINRLFKSSSWEDALKDPYFLINASFEGWHERVDESAWKLVDLSREAERIIFEHSAQLEVNSSDLLAIDYNSIHNLAKDAIHMVEGLDAVLRSLECALRYHSDIEDLRKGDLAIWEAIHGSLHYRKEMFHSTRLRMLSVEQRLKNVINMAFNIGTMHDSRVMRQDSYIMKTLSILAMVFLPISTVSSIFGTQFFSTTTSPDPTSSTGAVTSSFVVNNNIWLLWTISIPVTVALLVGWGVWIDRSQLKAKRLTYWIKDVEKAKSA